MSLSQAQSKTSTEDQPIQLHRICLDISAISEEANTSKAEKGGPPRAILTNLESLWENGTTLTYGFFKNGESFRWEPKPGVFETVKAVEEPSQRKKVSEVIKEWEKYANIKFELVDVKTAMIRIAMVPDPLIPGGPFPSLGSWSYVGKQIEGKESDVATMNLGWVREQADINEKDRALILHEFGHTLGLKHEHQSPLRGGKLTLKEDAVIREYMLRNPSWTEQTVKDNVINVYKAPEISNFTNVDLQSIMMYAMPKDLNEQDIEIEENTHLSETDKAFMQLNYPYFGSSLQPGGMSFTQALEVLGLEGEHKDSLIKEYENGNWQGIRTSYMAINAAMRANKA